MRRLEASLPTGRALLALDVALAVWTAAWIVMGVVVASELQGLAELSDTVGTVGGAAVTSGEALGTLSDLLPLVGGTLQAPADEVQEAGRAAQESGAASRESIDTLSVLLGVSVALIPSVPVLAGYVPGRVLRSREARVVDAARRHAGDDPLFAEFLARRAALRMSYRRLAEVSREPWREIEAGRFDRLAQAELQRLGLSPERERQAP